MKNISAVVLCLIVSTCLGMGCTSEPESLSTLGEGADEPTFIRLGWDDDPSTTAAVIWYTENWDISGAGVEYGDTQDFGNFVPARTFELQGFEGAFHQATITGLTPGSLVHYRVGSETGTSEGHTLATAPSGQDDVPFSFVLLGDSRSDLLGVGTGYPQLNARLLQEPILPAFILDTGDYTQIGRSEEWVEWLEAGQGVGAIIPRMTTFGNHEVIEQNYYGLMNLPAENDGQFWALEYGPLQIISMNTGFGEGNMPAGQTEWLEETLQNSDASWRVVFMHIPPYNSGRHGDGDSALVRGRLEVRENWTPLFEKHGVDLVVGGHDHNYQRFGHIKDAQRDDTGTAPFYVISGGAGAPLYGVNTDAPDHDLLEEFEKVEHYLVATLDGNELTVRAKKLDGTEVDTFTLRK